MRRRAPVVLVVVGIVLLVAWNVVYTQRVLTRIRDAERRQTIILQRVFRAQADSNPAVAAAALQDVIFQLQQSGVPMVQLSADGKAMGGMNLPWGSDFTDPRIPAYITQLAKQNTPVQDPETGTVVYFGYSDLVEGLRVIPLLQAGLLGALLLAGVYALVVRGRAEREHVWAGMARESAHQLGTPLSSLSGWIDLLDDEVTEQGRHAKPMMKSAVDSMKADLERLERVAHRFERIGREPKRDDVDVAVLVDRIVAYFKRRVPTRSAAVTVRAHRPRDPVVVKGDAVLLEWVLEALTKNAVDALAGRGGKIDVMVERRDDGTVRLRVADDGPGIPPKLRRRIFDAGFSTKERGWGIGLSLARRIVEENHGGRIALVPSDRGATFDVILS
ncbi:sensor histidine kinase [Roseisolibacter agri]|uniref:histidine kinase n=1 Tax=Roseisolibacter agri TaxID=2014610 RepID=A0AA37QIS9_9BACT|nr:HAMP domain-containing sensor histidine kinase [Roseisolibacter agri]GLC26588.1 two-component sensor histidine kinase [Roseisolibacter agri]